MVQEVREAVLRQSPVGRLRATLAPSESMREIALTGLWVRFPDRSTIELVEMLVGEPVRAGVRCGPTTPR